MVGDGDFAGAGAALVEGGHRLRQLPAAWARSFSVRGYWTSFSASAKVAVVTSGPTAGEVPKAGGAPGVVGVAGFWARLAVEGAAASRVSVLWVRNSRRDFDICPSVAIVAGVVKLFSSRRKLEDCRDDKKNEACEPGNHANDMESHPAIAELLPVCR